ncbi:hypothetical protein G9A89_015369 [Geosiphon pyriformis]|nr:hypothetical protein G9A89_015369 [Geosiphon pyriformis]
MQTKSKKAVPDICLEISNKISTRRAFSVVEATRQNVLEAFLLLSNHDKLPLVVIKATFSSLTVSPSVASTPIKSPKVFNNRLVNKLVFFFIASISGAASIFFSKKIVKKTKSSEKWEQLLVFAIVTPNPFVVSNEILDKISIVLSGILSKIGLDQLLVVLPNMVSSSRSLLVLEVKQSSPVGLPVLGNWADQMETESSLPLVSGTTSGGAWETITSYQKFAGWVASTLVPNATFKIKLAYVKAVFQSVHGFLDVKLVLKNNMKLFCMEFASQVFLEAAFLVELTSSVRLATLKIAKFLVVSEFGSPFAAVTLHDVLLDVSAANIKTVLSVFSVITHVVLKSAGIWQYVVVHFESLIAVISVLNYWSVLVDKDSVWILLLVNQQKTIVSCDRFKTKLVNLSPGCTAFEISNMVSQVGSQTCFIPQSPDFGCHFHFALVTFGSQADLDLAVIKTEIDHLAVNCKVAPPPSSKAPKMFEPHFVGSLSYAKASVLPVFSEFSFLVASAFSVAVEDSLVSFWLAFLESDLAKLSVLVEFIVKPIGSMVKVFKQIFNGDLVSSSVLGLKVNEILVHISTFSKTVGKLEREVIALKTEYDFENIDMSGPYISLSSFDDDMFSNLMSLWEHESAAIKTNAFKTAK